MKNADCTEGVAARGLEPDPETWNIVNAEALAFYFRVSGRIWTPWRPTERV